MFVFYLCLPHLCLDAVVYFDQDSYMILEGSQVIVCASLINTTLERNVSVMFTIQQSNATGIIILYVVYGQNDSLNVLAT